LEELQPIEELKEESKEITQLSKEEILKQVSEKQITQKKAGILLGVSRRTVGRRLAEFLDTT